MSIGSNSEPSLLIDVVAGCVRGDAGAFAKDLQECVDVERIEGDYIVGGESMPSQPVGRGGSQTGVSCGVM